MHLIIVSLAIVAIYCGASWLWFAWNIWASKAAIEAADNADQLRRDIQSTTFHLGLCFTLAAGFLGVILK